MELIFQLAAGAMGALTSVLLLALVSPALARQCALPPGFSGQPGVGSQIAQVAVRILAGVGFGLLFWLSWGLTAIVNVPWWQRGVVFTLLAWGVFALPLLMASALAQRMQWRAMFVIAVEWLVTAACASMTCAWVWIRPM